MMRTLSGSHHAATDLADNLEQLAGDYLVDDPAAGEPETRPPGPG